ncbi:DUF4013 domain-containing protein [Halosegnis sp.]|uniref:DUF4013 domain-containing protein n=1 Tax=Halosegnis sp. TaxID=2864959 RepID=UPI0035D475F1
MLREALDFPTSGDHGSRAVLVGSLLVALAAVAASGTAALGTDGHPAALAAVAVAGLATLAIRGYYYRTVAVAATRPSPVAPSFEGLMRLLREGIVSTLLAAAYALPAALLFAAAAGIATLTNPGANPPDQAILGQGVGALAALLGLLALGAALYLTPAAAGTLARNGTFRDAVRFGTVLDAAATEDYAVGWLVATGLQWTVGLVAVVLSALGIGVVLYFLTGVAARYLWGTALAAALDPGEVPTEGVTPPNRHRGDARMQELFLNSNIDEPTDGAESP